ncbi:DUF1150 family protein [Jannaschia sp. 2305UL9-9]|uniref:DUF1150 family protein n=1 Tax=Jannaschia sp. 2305UL9-9 TaxID=3121638 RepID=UPI003529023F
MTNRETLDAVEGSLVYVRKIALDALPKAVRQEAEDGGLNEIYAVHRADGEQVALVGDRSMAFDLARQNDLRPVSVH